MCQNLYATISIYHFMYIKISMNLIGTPSFCFSMLKYSITLYMYISLEFSFLYSIFGILNCAIFITMLYKCLKQQVQHILFSFRLHFATLNGLFYNLCWNIQFIDRTLWEYDLSHINFCRWAGRGVFRIILPMTSQF